jgi:hypothetical protein
MNCPKCGEIMSNWILIGDSDNQVWEKTVNYHCLDCDVVVETVKPAPEVDHNTDGFVM